MGDIIEVTVVDWRPEPDVYGEAAGYATAGGRVLDLVVTVLAGGGVEADVLDGVVLVWRGRRSTVVAAKAAALVAARRYAA